MGVALTQAHRLPRPRPSRHPSLPPSRRCDPTTSKRTCVVYHQSRGNRTVVESPLLITLAKAKKPTMYADAHSHVLAMHCSALADLLVPHKPKTKDATTTPAASA